LDADYPLMANKDKPFKHIVIVGCGDIGKRVAKIWKNTGKTVYAVTRSAGNLEKLKEQQLQAHQLDLDNIDEKKLPPCQDALLYYFAPPPRQGIQDTRIANFLKKLDTSKLPNHIVYISTSGVYGDQQGKLIDETTPVNPQVERAKRRYFAEQALAQWAQTHNVMLTLLRVGGIYGPGRLPLQRLKDQVPMLHENLSPQTNRIHADDLAQVCVATAAQTTAKEIYNVSDGTNSNMTEYFNTIADFCNLPRPPLVDWDEAKKTISKGMLSYLNESRRMDNSKMINNLKITLQYPTLKEGLKNCLD